MKIHVVHDLQGNIKSLTVPGPDFTDTLQVHPKENELITIVEQPDVRDEHVSSQLMKLSRLYQVDVLKRALVPRE